MHPSAVPAKKIFASIEGFLRKFLVKLAKSFLANRYFVFIQDRQDRQDEEKKGQYEFNSKNRY